MTLKASPVCDAALDITVDRVVQSTKPYFFFFFFFAAFAFFAFFAMLPSKQ
jgi:hypothetical protein